MRAALLAAFACSGFSGLVYQVVWARQFSLFLGHTTAAASAVVASVMGGLAVGAVVGARFAERWGGRRALQAYAVCEASAAALAMVVPVPIVLQRENVRTLPHDVFNHVEQLTAPRLRHDIGGDRRHRGGAAGPAESM